MYFPQKTLKPGYGPAWPSRWWSIYQPR